jgi:Coenzyme PQQ synthesis protein D (PqqD)
VSREIAGETVVVPICRGVGDLDFVYTFNALGTQLWGLLEKSRTEPELVAWVAEQYDVDETQAREDVRSFLADLVAVGLVLQA